MHLLNQSALLNTLGWGLCNSLWQMSLMWLLYAVITAGGKKFSANMRHLIALLLLGAGSVWFAFSLSQNDFNYNSSQQAIITTNIFSNAQASFLISTKQLISNLLPYCSVVYLMALVFLIVRYVKYYVSSQHLKQTGLHKAPVYMRIFIEDITARIGIHKTVRIWLSSVIQSPMTIGFLKPVILIPLATINHLSTQQMESVLLHELSHIKRNDYLLNLMVAFTEIIFFFNPFSLLLIHAIKKERENSCDDLVMQFRYDPCAYASALLSLERARHDHHKLAMAAVGKSNKMLLQRVMRLTEQKKIVNNDRPKFILILLIAAVAVFTAIMYPHYIVPKFSAHSSTSKSQNINPSELQQVRYVNLEAPVNKKSERLLSKARSRLNKAIDNEKFAGENDFALASNNEEEDMSDNENISQAIVTEPREYSIASPATPAPPANIAMKDYPYVPNASFSFKETEDTSAPKHMLLQLNVEKDAKLAMGKSREAINKTDWRKIEKEINLSRKDLYIAKLQNEIRKSLRDVDWDKLNTEVTEDATDETDEKRMRQDLQVQLQALQNMRYKDVQKTNQLQQQIIRQQLKLQQATIKKQQELMKQVEEIRKRIKIVYI